MKYRHRSLGFTLMEMLLVTAMAGGITVMAIKYYQQRAIEVRIESTAIQIQEILIAAAAYYNKNNQWPADLNCLKGIGGTLCTDVYLLSSITNSPFGNIYNTYSSSPTNFYVYTAFGVPNANLTAIQVAGKLPLASTGSNVSTQTTGVTASGACNASACNVVASINVPVQNLNKVQSVGLANLYHNGACVPKPTCLGNMQAQIYVVPASVTGINDAPTTDDPEKCTATNLERCKGIAYPLTDFLARAIGPASNPAPCTIGGSTDCVSRVDSSNTSQGNLPAGQYWRVCLNVVTEKGEVVPATNPHGQLVGTVMAITKCSFSTTKTGSDFTVWAP